MVGGGAGRSPFLAPLLPPADPPLLRCYLLPGVHRPSPPLSVPRGGAPLSPPPAYLRGGGGNAGVCYGGARITLSRRTRDCRKPGTWGGGASRQPVLPPPSSREAKLSPPSPPREGGQGPQMQGCQDRERKRPDTPTPGLTHSGRAVRGRGAYMLGKGLALLPPLVARTDLRK